LTGKTMLVVTGIRMFGLVPISIFSVNTKEITAVVPCWHPFRHRCPQQSGLRLRCDSAWTRQLANLSGNSANNRTHARLPLAVKRKPVVIGIRMSDLVPISIVSIQKLLLSCLSGPLQTQIFTTEWIFACGALLAPL
jgi:hypothetical protein